MSSSISTHSGTGTVGSISDNYQVLSDIEHILLKPGMYVGSSQLITEDMYIIEDGNIVKKSIKYIPALQRLYEEILLNAFDQTVRNGTDCSEIHVNIDKESNTITVHNNGQGLPIVLKEELDCYIPEMVFGMLRSGSNYSDEDRITGGTNGLGAKLANIFSTSFILETADSERKKLYLQEWKNNMSEKSDPKITSLGRKKPYTTITFQPDLKYFKIKTLTDDMIALMEKRLIDIGFASHAKIKTFYNGENKTIKKTEDYMKLYCTNEQQYDTFMVDSTCERWTVGIMLSSNGFNHASFVNGIHTSLGGSHVDHVMASISKEVIEKLKTKKIEIKPSDVKNKLFVFLKSTIVNPIFDSQTKECLKMTKSKFGSEYIMSDTFKRKLLNSDLLKLMMNVSESKLLKDLSKTSGTKTSRLIGIKGLEDANFAGTSKSSQTKLILTEGLSAKTFAMSAITVIGRDRFGIFPLKGKCNSEDTKIPLWNGEIKLAKDIQIGDILIGDDGNQRTVLTLHKGNGKMYEISQKRGETYKVNDEHILTLCMPEHKKIFWVPSNYTWRTIYWDATAMNVKAKETQVAFKVQCKECDMLITPKCIKKHYKAKHKNVKYVPYKLENQDMNNSEIIKARENLEEFLLTIDSNNIIDICIEDYLNVTESLKRKLKGIRGECVNWKHQDVSLDPYILGLWLGDGMSNGYAYSCDGANDEEIINYITKWGKSNDAQITKSLSDKYTYHVSSIQNYKMTGCAPLKKLLDEYNLVNNKHIPIEYLVNSKEIRLKVLAGIIDSDGYVHQDGTIEISQSTIHKKLADDIVYLSRSLGFYTKVSDKITNYKYKHSGELAKAYRIKISGNTDIIPTILPRKKCKSVNKYNNVNSTGYINVKIINNENYVGIGIDGNHRFVINDFTVTHNCLNVRGTAIAKVTANAEICNIVKILGLKYGEKYTDMSSLRYGGVIALTDADTDGSHICSLILNIFHYFWPELLAMGYLGFCSTPIVKVYQKKETLTFYTLNDYESWLEQNTTKQIKTKYFKGLGTSTAAEAREALENIDTKIITFDSDELVNQTVNLAFDKKQTNERKLWLMERYDPKANINRKLRDVSISDYINKELIHFSYYDNQRSIPNVMDGLKPSQRKILYTAIKYLTNSEMKVAQFGAKVAEKTDYHHGEASLMGAIINMAQNYVGTNNINLLEPKGAFGTRLASGADAASPRYIFTQLSDIAKKIFDSRDSQLLNYLESDGMSIEPEWFAPVIPMILVNGAIGIGSGFSTEVLQYNPVDICNYLSTMLEDNKPAKNLKPWYRGFNGSIERLASGKYRTIGCYEFNDTKRSLTITELPIGVWTDDYKDFIEAMFADKDDSTIADIRYGNSDVIVNIEIIITPREYGKIREMDVDDLLTKFKLSSKLSCTNMYLFNHEGTITKYNNVYEILKEFYLIRLDFYIKRRDAIIAVLKYELMILSNKVKFIEHVKAGKIKLQKIDDKSLLAYLINNEFDQDHGVYGEPIDTPTLKEFAYMIDMPIRSITNENAEKFKQQQISKQEELDRIIAQTAKDMWKLDLQSVVEANNKAVDDLVAANTSSAPTKSSSKPRRSKK